MIFFYSINVSARDVFLINYKENSQKAERLQKILEESFGIPKELIKLKNGKCEDSVSAIFIYCINRKEQVEILKSNSKIYNNSFRNLYSLSNKTKIGGSNINSTNRKIRNEK